jgi:copper oxidase (laccase) domain-containing protein
MKMIRLRPEYAPGGRALVELPGAVLHLVGIAGPMQDETEDVVFLSQVHGGVVLRDPAGWEEGDGMILAGRERSPGIRTADCLPVFLGSSGFSGGFHAGWRGIVAGIAGRMVIEYPERPEFVLLGNCICSDCYSVGEDVRRKVLTVSGIAQHPPGSPDEHPTDGLDLKMAVLAQMKAAGLPDDIPVYSIPECTMCRGDLFHSYRRDGTAERNLQWLRMD